MNNLTRRQILAMAGVLGLSLPLQDAFGVNDHRMGRLVRVTTPIPRRLCSLSARELLDSPRGIY